MNSYDWKLRKAVRTFRDQKHWSSDQLRMSISFESDAQKYYDALEAGLLQRNKNSIWSLTEAGEKLLQEIDGQ